MTNWKMKFYTIWAGQAVSILTSSVLQMALIWNLTEKTGSAAILSIASIAGFLPTAVLGLFAGAMVDRWNRKFTMIGADLFIAGVSMVLVVVALFSEVPVWLVLVILFVRSIGTAFHTPAISAITPLIVPESHLTKCSGYTQSLQTVGFMIGAAVAAALYPIWDMSMIVLLDVVGAVIATLTVAFWTIPTIDVSSDVKPNIFREMKDGYNILRQHRGLFALLWIGAVYTFLFSPINALFPLMCIDYFGGSMVYSSISEITFSIGMLLGGVILGVWGGFKRRSVTIVFSLITMGAAITLSGMLPPTAFFVFAILCIVMGFSMPFYNGPQIALMQEGIEPQYLGRVFGLYGSVLSFSMPLGLILSGLFADKAGIPNWFVICGIGCVILGGVSLLFKDIRSV